MQGGIPPQVVSALETIITFVGILAFAAMFGSAL
jgi:hypothetical protein